MVIDFIGIMIDLPRRILNYEGTKAQRGTRVLRFFVSLVQVKKPAWKLLSARSQIYRHINSLVMMEPAYSKIVHQND